MMGTVSMGTSLRSLRVRPPTHALKLSVTPYTKVVDGVVSSRAW
jgi:hypothetical protein